MGRTVISEVSLRSRLTSFGTSGYEVGLILGQSLEKEDYFIHLARTPPPRTKNVVEETLISSLDGTDESDSKKDFESIQDIQEYWLADHATDVTRMLPGGMRILGIFLAGPEDILDDSDNVDKLTVALVIILTNFLQNRYLCGVNRYYYILIYNSKTQRYVCKMIDDLRGECTLNPVDIKFRSKRIPWIELETAINLDRMFCIPASKELKSLKQQLQEILEDVSKMIDSALITIEGKIRSSEDAIETIIANETDKNQLQVDLYIPCEKSTSIEAKIKPCSESLWLIGQLVSKTFVTDKTSIKEATTAIKEDIIRSLASRLEMHVDSLIEEENGSPEENITLHEPPRRILIHLHKSRVTLSSYLFPGEEPQEALVSLQELLDVDVEDLDIQKEIECHAESIDNCQCGPPIIPVNIKKVENHLNSLHIIGLGVAILIGVIAMVFHHLY
ncbi:PREDICTED: protein odr-4 homolog [Polistes canadensis]|uniref:protein odr-4 homolog n=1 Tax=Polistes canadensis TaxID=91411 RepID=UPI000718AF46|nr:PREDICTED: protein odr-4 homolog [Polistes canadensis]